jgi:crotonobetainyl-CoA:carnitine CoA-transferase CaiB-like acyl-CoA transferase
VEATIASRTTAEWKTVLDARGIPASGVALPVEILDDAQPAANGMFHRFEHPALPVTVLGSPVHLDGDGFTPGPRPPPSEAKHARSSNGQGSMSAMSIAS